MQKINISAMCKTFFRPNSLSYLLESYGRYQNTNKVQFSEIIISDDSSDEIKEKNKEVINKFKKSYPSFPIKYLDLPFDTGLSYSRNKMLESAKSEFVLLLDDDLIFDIKCNIKSQLEILEKNNLDILGGDFYNLNTKGKKRPIFKTNFFGLFNENSQEFNILFIYNNFPKFQRCDIINNFFIGKKSKLKEIKWEEDLKVGEHEEFFIRAKLKHNASVGYSNGLFIKHYPIRSEEYSIFRNRFSGISDRANTMHKIKLNKIKKLINNKKYNELFTNKKRKKYSLLEIIKYKLKGNDYDFHKLEG